METNKSRWFVSSNLIAAGLLACSPLSHAAAMSWQHTHSGGPLDYLEEKWSRNDRNYDRSYSNTWSLLSDGFNPAMHSINAITVWFGFADDRPGSFEGAEDGNGGDVAEHVDVLLGGKKIWDDLEVDGRHPAATYTYYSMALDPVIHMDIFNDLRADGKLAYSVELQSLLANSGSESKYKEDTYLKVAKLQACFTPPTRSVPDTGNTCLALGVGLLGLGSFRRFLFKN